MHSDRRKYLRLGLSLKAHYRILESLGEHHQSVTKDISEQGICVPLSEKLESGTFLELLVEVPGDSGPVHAIGRVVWSRHRKDIDLNDTGICLVHIKQIDRERLHKHALL